MAVIFLLQRQAPKAVSLSMVKGLRMDSNTIEVDNDVTATSTHHVVTYSAKGLITGGRVLAAADLPVATASAKGAVIPGTGLAVDGKWQP